MICSSSFHPGECQEILSEPQGTDGMGKRYTFTINSPDEYITAIDVRAGGWIDAIRLHTNQKSSIWMGGTGGDEYHLRAPPGRIILGVMGTSGKFVGSFGLLLSRCSNELCVMCRFDYQPLFGKMTPPPPPGRKAGPEGAGEIEPM